ncbi:M48 family metalloprotease [Alteromonas lipolytica]|uniref:Putative beta-barrel assembly-enhancing protease n=1 Tax=Alteromonas lipolytica TaxID=1856405 RepID=A0A1E8FH61_9ALTE|nr:M48 family metalloprotease [Alteromonas lipolytica]OFI35282.1 peptidase M48 [Alteromonas lipolytica]GGF58258.1 putative beta-barrel assembly-enhancing protease [Alteromonas lipolytica]
MRQVFRSGILGLTLSITTMLGSASVFAQAVGNDKNALPDIGVVASEVLTLDKEMLIGDAIMRQMRGQAPVIDDPVLTEYLQDLGNRLVLQADNTKFPFEFFLINNSVMNAFAFYGGHVGVHSGILTRADTESEVASVLAHEITHVTQRHLARRALSQQRSSPIQIASMIGGILLAMANPQAGIAAMQTSAAMASQLNIDYTRSNEQEADRIGIDILYRAGFDPTASSTFFGKMAQEYRNSSRPPERLLTHPLTEKRIADARNRMGRYPEVRLPPSLPFNLAKARLLARYQFEPEYALEHFKAVVETNSFAIKEAGLYGLAIAYFANEDYANAQQINDKLLASDPNNLFYVDLATDIDIATGHAAEAEQMLRAQLNHKPRNSVVVLNLASAQMAQKKNEEAIELIRDYLLVHPDDQLAYQLLSDAYKANKSFKGMYQSKAELLALYGAYPNAIDELQHAYNYTGDDYLEKQRIRARIQQFRDEQEKLKHF